jgi:hypothetical protein
MFRLLKLGMAVFLLLELETLISPHALTDAAANVKHTFLG